MSAASILIPVSRWILIAGVGTSLAACRAAGPEIARYAPAAVVQSNDVVEWSDEVWESAREGDRARLDTLLGAPPTDDPTLESSWRRFLALERDASERLGDEVSALLERESASTDANARLLALIDLAEARRSGLPPALDREIASVLEPEIAARTAIAEACEREHRLEDAIDAWIEVSALAADGHHAALELRAMDRATRLPGHRPGAGRRDPLPPRVVTTCLALVVESHVARPDVATVLTAGFDALDHAAAALDGSDRDLAASIVKAARARLRTSLSSNTGDAGPKSNRLGPDVAREVAAAANELAAARDDGRLPESMADPIRVLVDGMLSSTDLRTRAFLGGDAEAVDRLLGATFVGIGVRTRPHPTGLELDPVAGSPARRAGVRAGDVLVSIDGDSIERMTADDILSRIGGRRGTAVQLGVRRDDAMLSIVVVREEIELESMHGWRQQGVDHAGRPVWDWLLDPEAGIAFVSIRQFDDDTDARFRGAIRDANRILGPEQVVQGLVIDLRDDPGGHRFATERLIDLFLADGELVRLEGDRDRSDPRRADVANTRLEGLPVVLLVDEHSASASELLAGMLQGAAEAVVVGERTFGKGSVQAVNPVPDGHVLVTDSWFLVRDDATDSWRPIDRERTDRWGVTPDLLVPMSDRETADVLAERSGWVSGRGRDVRESAHGAISLDTTTDRGLLQAHALLRARLLPQRPTPTSRSIDQ